MAQTEEDTTKPVTEAPSKIEEKKEEPKTDIVAPTSSPKPIEEKKRSKAKKTKAVQKKEKN